MGVAAASSIGRWGVRSRTGSSLYGDLRDTVDDVPGAEVLVELIELQQGNVSRAAKVLELSRVMLQRKMKVYGLRSG